MKRDDGCEEEAGHGNGPPASDDWHQGEDGKVGEEADGSWQGGGDDGKSQDSRQSQDEDTEQENEEEDEEGQSDDDEEDEEEETDCGGAEALTGFGGRASSQLPARDGESARAAVGSSNKDDGGSKTAAQRMGAMLASLLTQKVQRSNNLDKPQLDQTRTHDSQQSGMAAGTRRTVSAQNISPSLSASDLAQNPHFNQMHAGMLALSTSPRTG